MEAVIGSFNFAMTKLQQKLISKLSVHMYMNFFSCAPDIAKASIES